MTTNKTTKTTSAARCSTEAELTRADDLRLGDTVLLDTWKGLMLVVVTSLELVGDDVEVNQALDTNFSTSVGNTFHVVSSVR